MNLCVLILPYFGKFNDYFNLFLKTCSYNKKIDFLIITDNDLSKYDKLPNVKIINMSFERFKNLIQSKYKFKLALNTPYKLCDFKPTYGYVLQQYILDYEYWGHCDCDLLFGDLNYFLEPIFDKGYDKIFAAGHLTIYKNTKEVNEFHFTNNYNKQLYKDALGQEQIIQFDEYYRKENIHTIFLHSNFKVYDNDLSYNTAASYYNLRRIIFDNKNLKWTLMPKIKEVLIWTEGKVFSVTKHSKNEYMYIHFQMRKLKNNFKENSKTILIKPYELASFDGDEKKIYRKYKYYISKIGIRKFIIRFVRKIKIILGCGDRDAQ